EPVRVYRVKWEPEGRAAQSPATPAQRGLPKLQPMARPSGARRRQPPEVSAHVLGREAELTQLYGYWEKALSGERQMVFVAGEPGIGKTTLVDAFLKSLESSVPRLASEDYKRSPSEVQTLDPRRQTLDGLLWIGRGQCIEHYGAGEAYLPLLEALGRLGRESRGQRLIELLSQQAPTWLVQMPALLTA